MPVQAEERLFIEAMRDLNQQASRMQDEEKKENVETNEALISTQSCHLTALPSSGSRSSDEDDANHGIDQLCGIRTTALVCQLSIPLSMRHHD